MASLERPECTEEPVISSSGERAFPAGKKTANAKTLISERQVGVRLDQVRLENKSKEFGFY